MVPKATTHVPTVCGLCLELALPYGLLGPQLKNPALEPADWTVCLHTLN
uniref:Uncharacterized protein n=1 Tax=Anguilla anguilla TaxID=7936 RepID=A0A0E9WI59_ANGAN